MRLLLKYLNMITVLTIFFVWNVSAQTRMPENTNLIAKDENVNVVHGDQIKMLFSTPSLMPSSDTFLHSSIVQLGDEYAIQIGAFSIKNNALKLQQRLKTDGYQADVFENYLDGKNLLYLVWVGSYKSIGEARERLKNIKFAYNLGGLVMVRSTAKRQ